jgi:hypothetical protein
MATFPEQFEALLELIAPRLSARAVFSEHNAQATGQSRVATFLTWHAGVPHSPAHHKLHFSMPNAYVQGSLSKMCGGEVSSIGWQGLAHNIDCSINPSIKLILQFNYQHTQAH